MEYPRQVKTAMELLEKAGFEAYIVGGSLRNTMMGKMPNDWDMTTSALPEDTLAIFRDSRYHVIETGLSHGTVTVIIDRLPIEITTFRIDGEYTDSRHPEEVTFTRSLGEDLARRDFTVNAMAYSESSGIVDLYGGSEDLKKGILRAVGDPKKRFSEDALRILRAFRFASEHGFEIEEATEKAICTEKEGLRNISRERICSELRRILLGGNAVTALDKMQKCRIFATVFDGIGEGVFFGSEKISSLPLEFPVRLSFLLGRLSEELFKKAINSLKLSNFEKDAVKKIMLAAESVENGMISDIVAARRLVCRCGEYAVQGAVLAFAWEMGFGSAEKLIEKALSENFPRSVSELDISGSDIMAMGVSGRSVGVLLNRLHEEVIAEPTLNSKEWLAVLAEKIIMELKK